MFHEMDRKQRGRVGKDVDVKLKLTFLEAINGCTKEVRYNTGGGNNGKFTRGKKNNEAKFKTVDVKVPAGVDSVSERVYLFIFIYFLLNFPPTAH